MSNKPFNGNGIPTNLNESSSTLYNDEYFQLLKKTLTEKNIVNNSREETKNLQKSLLYPYLEFFIRNDKNDFYKKLFFNRGIAKNQNGNLKDNLNLISTIPYHTMHLLIANCSCSLHYIRPQLQLPSYGTPFRSAATASSYFCMLYIPKSLVGSIRHSIPSEYK